MVAGSIAAAAAFAGLAAPARADAARFGIGAVDPPPAYRERSGYAGEGAYVARVTPGSPAELTRLLPGDVVVRVDGAPVTGAAAFERQLLAIPAGRGATFGVVRYGRAVALTVSDALAARTYDAAPLCDAAAAARRLAAAGAAGRAHDAATESREAERALNGYALCSGPGVARHADADLKIADSLLLQGAAQTIAGSDDEALPFLTSARVLYRALATTAGVPGSVVEAARRKIAAIERAVPATAASSPPSDLLAALATPIVVAATTPAPAAASPDLAATPGASTFAVVAAWSSPGSEGERILHLRVRMRPAKTVTYAPQGFRLRVVSPTVGTETVFAFDKPAPSYEGTNYSGAAVVVDKPEVVPAEDFGVHGALTLHAGDDARFVLTFSVPADANLRDAPKTLQYAL